MLGTIERVDEMQLTIRVAVAYRGIPRPGALAPGAGVSLDGCAFPWARRRTGTGSSSRWSIPPGRAYPNTGVWVVDPDGRILDPADPPWIGAGAPATVAEALRTMGIAAPDSATTIPAPDEPTGGPPALVGAVAWVAGLTCVAWWLGRRSRARR